TAAEHHARVAAATIDCLFHLILPYRTEAVAERRQLADEAERAWSRATESGYETLARFARWPLFYWEGEWDEGRALASEATARVPTNRNLQGHILLGLIACGRGEWTEAWVQVRNVLPEGTSTEPRNGMTRERLVTQQLAVALALDEGDLATAREW